MRAFYVESEFWAGLTAACGPCALASAESNGLNAYIGSASTPATVVIYHRMRAAGRCDANGASRGAGLLAQAQADGFTCERLGYWEGMPQTKWQPFLQTALAKGATVVTELSAAHNLRDAYSGAGMDAGPTLAYHYICACEWHPGGASARANGMTLPAGFWCADGDSDANNPVVGGVRHRVQAGHVLQFYPLTTLAAAAPCDLIAVYPRVSLGATTMAGTPAGWTDDGTTLKAPNGVVVVHGFRDWVLAHAWDAEDWPLAPEFGTASVEPGNPAIGAGSRQDFRKGSLGYTVARGAYPIWVGQDLLAYRAQVASLQAQLATAQAAVAKPDPVKDAVFVAVQQFNAAMKEL